MHLSVFYALTFAPAVLLVSLFAFLKLRAQRPHGTGADTMIRAASLSVHKNNEGGWWFGLLSTLLPIVGTATLLTIYWKTIPDRFPIHWGIDGQPNGWAVRGPGSIFGPLLLGLVLISGLGLLGELIARSSPGHEGRPAMIRTTRTVLVACSWFVTVLLCAISLLPLSHNPTNFVPFLSIGACVIGLGVVVYTTIRASRMRETMMSSQNSTDGRFWKAGLLYFNPADSALMVPKREGFGYTLNFGRPVCWLILAFVVLIPLILPILLHVSRHR